MELKRCTYCQQDYPFTTEHFHRSKSHPGGLYPICKECARAKKRAFDARNRELVNGRERDRRANSSDTINQRRRELRAANPDLKRQSDQRYYRKNKHKIQAYQLKWGHQNPAKKRALSHRYLARKHSLPNTFTADDWQRAVAHWNGCCAYCGNPPGLWNRLTADHYIPLTSGGGTVNTNIIPVCQSCNSSKNDTLPDLWLPRKFGTKRAAAIKAVIEQYFKAFTSE